MDYIEIGQIDIDPKHNVRQVDEGKVEFRELVASIQKHGVLQPVGIYKNGTSSRYGLVFGFRRVAAAKEAGLGHVPYVLVRGNTPNRRLKAIIENVHREDMGLADEANAVKVLMEEFGMDRHRVHAELNKSLGWVDQRVRFFKMDEVVQKKVAEGKLSITAIRELSVLPKEEQRVIVEEAEKHGGDGVLQQNIIRSTKNRRRRALMAQSEVPEIKRIQMEQKKEAVDAFCKEVHYGQVVPDDARDFLGDFYDFLFERKKIRIL